MSNVKIDIVSEFRGQKAFNQAGQAVSGLDKTVNKLAKRFIGLYSTAKLISFAKQSAEAFANDQKQAALLTNTVKNLGLAFAAPQIEQYIQKLQQTSGVLDDELRPAMQKLLTTTGSIEKSQQLLAQAIDISRGSGVELGTVVSDLSAAYVGNTKGLKKYALGLSQAELKAMSFNKIQSKLNDQFGGASQTYLNTYAGKITKLSTAFQNAKENIGKGLLDGLSNLGTDGVNGIDAATGAMDTFSQKVGDAIYGVSVLVNKLGGSGSAPSWLDKATNFSLFGVSSIILDKLAKTGATARSAGLAPASANTHLAELTAAADAEKKRKAEALAAKRAKELAAAQKAQTKALKDQALLKKQSALFDMQQIQLVAALKGKLSEEDKNRVLLQLALLQGNEEAAAKLSVLVANSIDKTGQLAKLLTTLPDANNPFKNWDTWLTEFIKKYKEAFPDKPNPTPTPTTPVTPVTPQTPAGTITDASSFIPKLLGGVNAGMISDASSFFKYTPQSYNPLTGAIGGQTIIVQIDGKAIASSLQDQSLSGNNTTVNRTTGSFSNF